jgi:hypothetical protein
MARMAHTTALDRLRHHANELQPLIAFMQGLAQDSAVPLDVRIEVNNLREVLDLLTHKLGK